MGLPDEQADVLGGPILQRPESGVFATFSQYRFVVKSVTLLGLGLLVWIACARGLEHLKKHRELKYRKAMRRKHGIPDSDCRPFAVAYAAAKRTHLEREAQDRKKATNYVSVYNLPADDQRTDAQKNACLLRRRVHETTVQLPDYQLHGKHSVDNKRQDDHSLNFADRYDPNLRRQVSITGPLLVERPRIRSAGRNEPDPNEESKKRSLGDESDIEHEAMKKSRMDLDEPIDGDEQADWYAQYSERPFRRRSKEFLDGQPQGNYVHTDGQETCERVDDLRDEDHEPSEAMEIDGDEVMKFKAVARGKKRDRAEAGSTFGGDDEDDFRNGRISHHRKRRTILRRRAEIPARGLKRDREVESLESDDDGVDPNTARRRAQRSSKKRKDKKVASNDGSELSEEDPRVSKDPLCGGRRIGDDWEADGVQYKVSDKGERLRLTLVKKARNKYHMPQDSQHPDRSAALEIFVETWMTEEQYRQAESRQELAWQETSRESTGSKTLDVLDSPTKSGKNLLWDSVKCSSARRSFRQFTSSSTSINLHPYEQWQSQPILGRRVASSSTIISPVLRGVADIPTRPGFRGFSKWEKQDREADAMARIRAKIEEQKKAQAPSQKSNGIPASVAASELGTKPLPVPTITLTPAPAVATEGKLDESTPQGNLNISPFFLAASPSTSDSIKGTTTVASATSPGFSLSSTSATKPFTSLPGATTPTTTSSVGSISPFSFVKPPQVSSSTPPVAPSSVMPSIFGKGTSTDLPSSTVPSSSTLSSTIQPQTSVSENVSKPTPFSFTKSDTPSSSVSSAVIAPPITKSQGPDFNASTRSSLVTFDSTIAATKVENSATSVSTSAATSESLKSANPLFSFSGAPSSPPAVVPPTSSTSSVPKFSFGQPTATSPLAPSPGTASQPRSTFKFGQSLSSVMDGAPMVPAVNELKNSTVPVSVFGIAAASNEPTKPSPSGTTSAFGSSTHSLPSVPTMNPFVKPVTADNDPSTSVLPKPAFTSPRITTFDDTTSPASTGTPASGNAPVFSFSGTNSGSKYAERTPLFGGAKGGSYPAVSIGGNSTGGKSSFVSGASADGPKPTSVFGGNMENPKSSPLFGGSAEGLKPALAFGNSGVTSNPASVFGGAVEGSKSMFTFGSTAGHKATSGPATESSKSSNDIDPSKSNLNPGSAFGPFSSSSLSTSSSTFGKDDAAQSTSTSMNTQTMPASSVTFETSSDATGLVFGQPTASDASQPVFNKSTFSFAGTGGSTQGTFTFGKPAAQNQKQEQ